MTELEQESTIGALDFTLTSPSSRVWKKPQSLVKGANLKLPKAVLLECFPQRLFFENPNTGTENSHMKPQPNSGSWPVV